MAHPTPRGAYVVTAHRWVTVTLEKLGHQLVRLRRAICLGDSLLRFDAQGGIVIVGQRVGKHDHRIPRHAADVRHGLRRVRKSVRDDRRGRDAGFFR